MSRPSLAEAYTGRRNFPPFASGDSSLLLNLYPVITAANVAAASLTVSGSGSSFDPELGFKTGASGYLLNSNWLPAQDGASGTIYLELEREGFARDVSFSSGAVFYDSEGLAAATVAGLAERWILSIVQTSPSTNMLRVGPNSSSLMSVQHYHGGVDGNANAMCTAHSRAPDYADQRFSEVVLTWAKGILYCYVDGLPSYTRSLLGTWGVGFFKNLAIGRYVFSGSTFQDYYIRSCQISTKFCQPVTSGPKVALYGDSFVVSGDLRAAAGADTVAGINAVQESRTALEMAGSGNFSSIRGQCNWWHLLVGKLWKECGFVPPTYNAAKSGCGWHSSGAPVPTAYTDALNAFRPEVIVAFGSVNDVPYDAASTLVADVRAKLDAFANGNSALRRIIYVEPISWEASTAGPTNAGIPQGTWETRYQNQRSALEAGITGYLAGTRSVPVTYVSTYDEFYNTAGVDVNACFIGSAPTNTTTSADGQASQDAHPTATGHARIASILWPYLRDSLAVRPSVSRLSA